MCTMFLIGTGLMFFNSLNHVMMFLVMIVMLCIPYLKNGFTSNMFYHCYGLSVDKLSTFLIILSVWMTMLMYLSMLKANKLSNLMMCFSSLKLMLMFSFACKSLMNFYMFFELSLIPTLIMILGWGVQPERIRAGTYLMLYTLMGSLPLLGCLLYMDFHCGTVKIFMKSAEMYFFGKKEYSMFCLFWMLAFLIKLPIYGVHTWLPKAHVEAPVAGSMVLAGVLLKLGAYGLLRSLHFLELKINSWNTFLFSWSIITMNIVGLICFRQCDLKSLVAYSSVAHMSLVLAACFSCDTLGFNGAMSMLVSHGLCSSGLFFGVQGLYKMSGTRNIFLNRGLMKLSPIFCLFWFMLCVGKCSAPPSLNLFSEFLILSNVLNFGGMFSAIFCGMSIFLSGLFSMYLYILMGHGKWSVSNKYWKNLPSLNKLVLFLHAFPLYSLFLFGNSMFYVS